MILRTAEPFRVALTLIVFVAGYELLAWGTGLPHVPAVYRAFVTGWSTGPLAHDVAVSGARWLSGWVVGAVLGVGLGVATGRIRAIRFVLEGPLVLCRALPFVGLLPLTIRVYGLSETGKILLVAWSTAGTCWLVVHQAARALPDQVRWRCVSLGLGRWRRLFQVVLPMCAPGVYTGLRASLSLGIIVIGVAELGGVYARSSGLWWSEGLGYRLFRCLEEARDDLLLAALFTFALVGVVADRVFTVTWVAIVGVIDWAARRRVRREVRALAADADASPAPSALHDPPAALTVSNLTAGYDGPPVIEYLSLSIPAGRTLAILAPSGSGKTTLLRAIGGLGDERFRASGKIALGGVEVGRAGTWVGLVLQESPVFGHLTVWDNVGMGERIRSLPPRAQARWVWSLLKEFGLQQLADRRSDALSVGQRQRLSLATALANRPACLLLDEPFSSLDYLRRRQLQEFYRRLTAGKVTAVFVTHDISEALVVGDFVRVGLAADSTTVPVPQCGKPGEPFEDTQAFREVRKTLLSLLEEVDARGNQNVTPHPE